MSSVKNLFFHLTHQPIGSVAPTPPAVAPRLPEVHILTHFGEVVGAYANNASAKADMAIMQHGAYLNGDTRDGDAYEVLTLTVFSQ
jgi:hypothetical protein